MQQHTPPHNPLAPTCAPPGYTLELARPPYGPLVETCAAYGIKRTRAHEYVKSGLIDTFTMGVKRYVYLASLDRLPERMAAASEKEAAW